MKEFFLSLIWKNLSMAFNSVRNIRFPTLGGRIEAPIMHKGKKLYPVILELQPGSAPIVFTKISCNCPFYLPNEEYLPDMIICPGNPETTYYPTKLSPNPLYQTIVAKPDHYPQYKLIYADVGDKDLIKIQFKGDGFFAPSLRWVHSVV